jgi:hypothetical protein
MSYRTNTIRFQFFTAMRTKTAFFRDATPCVYLPEYTAQHPRTRPYYVTAFGWRDVGKTTINIPGYKI